MKTTHAILATVLLLLAATSLSAQTLTVEILRGPPELGACGIAGGRCDATGADLSWTMSSAPDACSNAALPLIGLAANRNNPVIWVLPGGCPGLFSAPDLLIAIPRFAVDHHLFTVPAFYRGTFNLVELAYCPNNGHVFRGSLYLVTAR